jgi:hypothetical protein
LRPHDGKNRCLDQGGSLQHGANASFVLPKLVKLRVVFVLFVGEGGLRQHERKAKEINRARWMHELKKTDLGASEHKLRVFAENGLE